MWSVDPRWHARIIRCPTDSIIHACSRAVALASSGNLYSVADEFTVICPYCGEAIEIYIEPDVRGSFVQDCEVCCNPWRVRVSGRGDARRADVQRADGTE